MIIQWGETAIYKAFYLKKKKKHAAAQWLTSCWLDSGIFYLFMHSGI